MLLVCTTGVHQVSKGILYPLALSISVMTFLFKKSVVDYNLIDLGLQANYPHGSGKFSHNENQYLVYNKWDGVCYWCAQLGVHQVWEGILYPLALSKSVILLLSKKSLVGYNLIGLGSQANYPYGSGKFSHNRTNTWFTTNGMGCVIGVHSLGPPSLRENSFSSCSFHNGNQYLVYNKWDGGWGS